MIRDIIATPNSGDKAAVFTALTGTNSYADGDATYDGICEVCHTTNSKTYHYNNASGNHAHNAGQDCIGCHPHGDSFTPSGGSCLDCHNTEQNGRRIVTTEFTKSTHHLQNTLDAADCEVCHDQSDHQLGIVLLKDADGGVSYSYDSGDPNAIDNFCKNCHDADGASGDLTPFTDNITVPNCTAYEQHNGNGCITCHAAHGSDNLNLINELVNSTAVTFTAVTGANSYADGDGTFDGICEVCHTSTKHHTQTSDGHNHQDGTNCTTCHTHAIEFSPQTCTDCHSSTQGSTPPISGIGGQFDKTSNHAAGADATDAECAACHYPVDGTTVHMNGSTVILKDPDAAAAWSGDKDNYCMACHDGDPAVDKKTTYLNSAHDNSATNSCALCHTEHGSANANLLIQSSNYSVCRTCHDGTGVAPKSSIDIDVADKAVTGVSGNSHAWDITSGGFGTTDPTTSPMDTRLDGGTTIVCSTCHDPHDNTNGSFLVNDNSTDLMCKDCHADRNEEPYPVGLGSHPVGVTYTAGGGYKPAPTLADDQVGLIGGKIECSSCHSAHNATTTDGNLLREAAGNTMCQDCHNYQPHFGGMECIDCHDTHGTGTNIYLIKNTITTPNSGSKTVVFTAQTEFSDGDGTYDGVCEVCHTSTAHHTNTNDGHDHKDGTNCTGCHAHNDATNSFPSLSCLDCHNSVQGSTPQISGPGGQFDQFSNHAAGADATDAECAACHYPVDGTTVHMNGSTVILKDPDAAAAWSGDKDNYCMGCHDGDPALDKKTTYLNSAHDNSATNSCALCHNKHGSDNANLLTQSSNYSVCRTCHDGTGVAPKSSIDIDVADKAVTGVSGNSHAWDIATGSFGTTDPTTSPMNTRLEGGNVVCSTCHDPHDNTNGSFLVNDNSADLMCKDCHADRNVGSNPATGSHPVGVTYTEGGTYNTAPVLSSIKVGPVGGNGGTVQCTSCHSTHNATTSDGNLLRQTAGVTLCEECHSIGSGSGTPTGTHNGMNCIDCHTPHNAGSNIYLVSTDIGGSAVIHETSTDFGDQSGTEDGVCEVCHTSTSYYLADGSGSTHNLGTDCITCHSHNTNFAAPSCHGCHDADEPYEYPTAPDYTEGAHGKHINAPNHIKCNTCHFGLNSSSPVHNDGNMDIIFEPGSLAFPFGADAGLTPTYNTGTHTCTNIYCHSNGRNAYVGSRNGETWSKTTGSQSGTFASPVWTGTITDCNACHAGNGNMSSPYTISPPFQDIEPPPTGKHASSAHNGNSQEWDGVVVWTNNSTQCMFCHNVDGGDCGTSAVHQGTYGTSLHLDGVTHFDPKSVVSGGTLANAPGGGNYSYSKTGSATHCGAGKKCW